VWELYQEGVSQSVEAQQPSLMHKIGVGCADVYLHSRVQGERDIRCLEIVLQDADSSMDAVWSGRVEAREMVGGAYDIRDPVLNCPAGHLQGFTFLNWPIIYAGQNMAMNVYHVDTFNCIASE
jgi:hypothetical protein